MARASLFPMAAAVGLRPQAAVECLLYPTAALTVLPEVLAAATVFPKMATELLLAGCPLVAAAPPQLGNQRPATVGPYIRAARFDKLDALALLVDKRD